MSFQRPTRHKTRGHVAKISSGRNGIRPREIVFDSEAREQYLTGFHKRNVERKEKAAERAKEHERRQKLDERQALREQRKMEIEENMRLANLRYKDQLLDSEVEESADEAAYKDDEEEEWSGIVDSDNDGTAGTASKQLESILKSGDRVRHVQKYKSDVTNGDEPDDLNHGETTVIIENYDGTEELNQNEDIRRLPDDRSEEVLRKSLMKAGFYAERVKKINSGRPVAPKKPKKKFRYLTPLERKANARKERTRHNGK
ncbi:nucleolar protein 12-domain-containing protein [Lipomyces kononenkoae]|uniref:Nucleolar protein 12-domain-containing protein n=1 Tax=Lipomyces kononenkoae TaxID=34357 RepID=A0ACC3T0E0_LIPKO